MNKDVKILKNAFISAYHNIYNFYHEIDKLNVFPVPDGDTGTNMFLTMKNGISYIENENFDDIGKLSAAFSKGLIMGARGNSGVILSQIFKGISLAFIEKKDLSINAWILALKKAKEVSYDAIMEPVEGTIITVVRETYEAIVNFSEDKSIQDLFKLIVEKSNVSLENTPELLPVLKEVGVVDSGGFGLVKIFEALEYTFTHNKVLIKKNIETKNTGNNVNFDLQKEEPFGYCTEAIITLSDNRKNAYVNVLRNNLANRGCKSIVAVKDEGIIKTHVHTRTPGLILTMLQQYGEFQTLKIDNMMLQAEKHVVNINTKRELKNKLAVIAVLPTPELAVYFKDELNCNDVIISPGMNPSTDDIIAKIEEVDAKHVYILPNNSNVILACEQAVKLEKKSSVYVIPSKTIPEGVSSLMTINTVDTPKKNIAEAKHSIRNVKTLLISKAVKKTHINGLQVEIDDYIGIVRKQISFVNKNMQQLLKSILKKNVDRYSEIITIYKGADCKQKDLDFLLKIIDENYDVEYEIIDGKHKLYPLILAVE
ncbi:DAK2 domain-containing protein [Spiroplasma endosymbiont of Amphibalanus improvisus]|uniref:DAK2 domain-containing protein n=1 Tax=Spiroplasma endosymbiont of Amphibalanus improvisus TaxID=3066327 RepID=UPI00313D5768